MSVKPDDRLQTTDHGHELRAKSQEHKADVVILHGIFDDSFYKDLKKRNVKNVFVLESRPNLDGAKVTCQSLLKHKIKPTLIADNMAGFLFFKNLVKEVYLAHQVEDKNGALCPIGSLILAVLAKKHQVKVSILPAGKKSKLLGSSKDLFSFNGAKVVNSKIDGYVPLVEWVDRKYLN